MGKYDGVEHIGVVLVACRDELNITQAEAARRMGVSAATLSRWENADQEPTDAVHIAAIVKFLNLGVEDLSELVLKTKLYIAMDRAGPLSREDARILQALARGRPPPHDAGR